MNAISTPWEKILNRTTLLERFGPARKMRIAFTNGCFDLLHRGHVEYLFEARELADALIIGLNTDASVSRLKGPLRPLVAQEDRAVVLAGLACVDALTIFDEDTPRDLIAELLPDVLVKGGDYEPHQIVGGDEVEANGGRVVVLPYREGRSSTGLMERILASAERERLP